jgi:ABC-type glycerol-3-phosphate transport system permease component
MAERRPLAVAPAVSRAQPAHSAWPSSPLELLFRGAIYLLLALGAIVTLFPYFWMLSGSFKDTSELFNYPPAMIPSTLRWENYRDLFVRWPFGYWFSNSLIVTVSQVVLSTFIAGMGGFGFARYEFKGRGLLFALLLGSLMIPFWIYAVPLYVLVINVGLLNSDLAIVVPWLGSAFAIFLCRQYMLTIPAELLDAARIDGASEVRIMLQIAMPLARPALAAVAITVFLSAWNAFFWPLVIFNDETSYTLPVGLALLTGLNNGAMGQNAWGPLMAGSFLASVPIIGMFLLMQRQFISGMVTGAVKT